MIKKKVALVLSSGGARGLAHIGVIEELESRGYEISSVSGTSIGAVVGGAYAAGALNEYASWVRSLTKTEVLRLMDFTLSLNGVMKGEKVFDEMKKRIPDRKIEDLNLPFVALATDLITKQEVVFKSGSLYKAMRASVSIPTVFIPYKLESMRLVDGGLLNPIPIKHVERNAGDILVAVNLNSDNYEDTFHKIPKKEELNETAYNKFFNKFKKNIPEKHHEKLSYFNILNTTIGIMLSRICDYELQINKPDVLIDLPRNLSTTFEFYNAGKIIEKGREAARLALEYYEKKALSE